MLSNTGSFHCDYGYNIECGGVFFQCVNCVVFRFGESKIGSNVLVLAFIFYTAAHPLDKIERRT
jgi:maltose O-acetyltransferase